MKSIKKVRAAAAGIAVALVAGASATLWFLNDNGVIGREDGSAENVAASDYNDYLGAQDGYPDENGERDNAAFGGEDKDENNKTDETTTGNNNESPKENNGEKENYTDINEFLSVFSGAYFSENLPYSRGNINTYELIRFAYAHFRAQGGAIVTKQDKDSGMWYGGIAYDDVNDILGKYLGVSVSRESVYTQNGNMFFKYEDGCFYTPAADGVGYSNIAVASTVKESNGKKVIEFTVYSFGADTAMSADEAAESGEVYAYGTAVISEGENGYILEEYAVSTENA